MTGGGLAGCYSRNVLCKDKYWFCDENRAAVYAKKGFAVSESAYMRWIVFFYLDGVGADLDFQHTFNSFNDTVKRPTTNASYITGIL